MRDHKKQDPPIKRVHDWNLDLVPCSRGMMSLGSRSRGSWWVRTKQKARSFWERALKLVAGLGFEPRTFRL